MGRSKAFNIFSTIFILSTLFVGVYLVGVKTGFINRASGIPANIVVDAGISFPDNKSCWRNFAQGGEEKGRMLSSVVPLVKKLQPEYIRIDHIYDMYDVVRKSPDGSLDLNWQNLDQTVEDIRATGALPYFSLSYMPPSLSSESDITGLPTGWVDWEVLVQRTVEHYSGRRGMNLNNVYYEVWNEPDLFGKYKVYGNKNYLDLYYHSQLGAVRASNVNSFKIGGPATTNLYKSWFDALLKEAQEGKIRLDFYSWHKYTKDLDDMESDINSVKEWLQSYPSYTNLELNISETGINSENDKAYDGNLSAIHTIASAVVYDDFVSKCFNFELKDGPGGEKYWGRWGMITHEKFGEPETKPRFSAVQFLNQMDGFKMNVSGNGSWVKSFARYNGEKIKLLVVNYDPKGEHIEAFPISFINLPFTNFTFRRINFSGERRDRQIQIDTNSWSTTEGLDPNTSVIFEIIPQK